MSGEGASEFLAQVAAAAGHQDALAGEAVGAEWRTGNGHGPVLYFDRRSIGRRLIIAGYWPLKIGFRFSEKAITPSRASAEAVMRTKAGASSSNWVSSG